MSPYPLPGDDRGDEETKTLQIEYQYGYSNKVIVFKHA